MEKSVVLKWINTGDSRKKSQTEQWRVKKRTASMKAYFGLTSLISNVSITRWSSSKITIKFSSKPMNKAEIIRVG